MGHVEVRQTNKGQYIQEENFSHLYVQWSTSGISLAGGLPSVS